MVPNHIVYSTETGKVNAPAPAAARSVSKDGIVRLKRETKGRKGKVIIEIIIKKVIRILFVFK